MHHTDLCFVYVCIVACRVYSLGWELTKVHRFGVNPVVPGSTKRSATSEAPHTEQNSLCFHELFLQKCNIFTIHLVIWLTVVMFRYVIHVWICRLIAVRNKIFRDEKLRTDAIVVGRERRAVKKEKRKRRKQALKQLHSIKVSTNLKEWYFRSVCVKFDRPIFGISGGNVCLKI